MSASVNPGPCHLIEKSLGPTLWVIESRMACRPARRPMLPVAACTALSTEPQTCPNGFGPLQQ